MRNFICIIITYALMTLCVSAQSIIGTWEVVRTEIEDNSLIATLTFNEDGTFARDQSQSVVSDSGEKTVKTFYHDEGNWNFYSNGKKVMMKIKPSSIKIDSGERLAGGIGKAVEAFSKIDAFMGSFSQKIVSLTDTELILLETGHDEDGDVYVEEIKYVRRPAAGTPKNLFTLFDSLGQTGVWQTKLAELSGMNFDAEGNFNYFCPISYGGACTGLYGPICGMQRARNLIEVSKTKSIDIIMMENTNDIGQFSNLGTLDDQPWFWSYTCFTSEHGLNSKQDAIEYWESDFSSIIGKMSPQKGAVVRIPYLDSGISCEVEVTSGAKEDGTLNLHCREWLIPVPVKAGMDAEQLVDYLMTVALRPGCECIRTSATGLSLRDYIKGTNTFAFDCGNTGIMIDVKEGTGMATYDRFYVGNDISEWTNPGCWTSAPTLYSQWKGFVEFILENFPKADKYWFIPTYYMCSTANEAIREPYFAAQKRLAEHYGIKVLDIAAESGINEENVLEFYNSGDVHPKDSGYLRWGETAYRLISPHDLLSTTEE